MTSEDLKNLVKEYFNLVEAENTEETFGELYDENKAFRIKFPGDSIQVGDKVTVITAEDQEIDAPDGEHRLEDGTKIITEGSVVKEIISADDKKEMATEEEVADVVEEAVTDVVEEAVADAVEETVAEAVDAEEIVKAIADALQEEMKAIKEKMAELEGKVKGLEEVPAAEKTVAMNKSLFAAEAPKTFNSSNMDIMLNMIKSKKK